MNLYQHAKNEFIPSVHSSDKVNFRVLSHDWPYLFLTMPTSNIFSYLLICMDLCQDARNQLIPSFYSWYTVLILEPREQIVYTQFRPCPTNTFSINFWFLWICINMLKMRLFYWFILEKYMTQKLCNMTGWEHFGLYLRKKIFAIYRICPRTQQIIKRFIIEQIQWKLMTKFLPISSILAHILNFWT